jgi:short-subunit dehydrogenase
MGQTILITGASSGIGRALALHFAREKKHLALLGRDASRIEDVVCECRALGADVQHTLIDVRSRDQLARWIAEVDHKSPIEMVIANAGVMTGTPPGGIIEGPDDAYTTIEINLLGVLNTVQPLIGPMIKRRRGQIAIISSLAAFISLPDSPGYCASKSAILSYGLSLRSLLKPYGLSVSVVCPGYVTTAMTEQECGSKPFEMKPDKAVNFIVRGLMRNQAIIAFPFFLSLATRLHGILPDTIRSWLLMRSRFTVSARL